MPSAAAVAAPAALGVRVGRRTAAWLGAGDHSVAVVEFLSTVVVFCIVGTATSSFRCLFISTA